MAKKKEAEKKEVKKSPDGFYKGYDIKWLRKETSHPEHYLVAEYDALEVSSEEPVEGVTEEKEVGGEE